MGTDKLEGTGFISSYSLQPITEVNDASMVWE